MNLLSYYNVNPIWPLFVIFMSTLHIVHCVDTEGPLDETIESTFERLKNIFNISLPCTTENLLKLQQKKINLDGREEAVARLLHPKLLNYNNSWKKLNLMLDKIFSKEFRNNFIDDFENCYSISWHCLDHMYYKNNPRNKDLGYGKIFRPYRRLVKKNNEFKDEVNWHFHPIAINNDSLSAGTSYTNSFSILTEVLCRRILDDDWFPVVNRPGFHSERPDSHAFLEQWIPFDYANQYYEKNTEDQSDLSNGRFGDWRRSSASWCGYHPSHEDYQIEGNCKRIIFRCLNIGTRFRVITQDHIRQAFNDAKNNSKAILSFANHDYRDMCEDIININNMINEVKKDFNDVKIRFSGAEYAAIDIINAQEMQQLKFETKIDGNNFIVKIISGELFGPQPFLAIKTKDKKYLHDNFDVVTPNKVWSYTFDSQSFTLENILEVGAGSAGKYGSYYVDKIKVR